jgi:hypothetical protein
MGSCAGKRKFEPNDKFRSQSSEALAFFLKLGLSQIDVDLLYSAFYDIDSTNNGFVSIDEFINYFDLQPMYMELFIVSLFLKDAEYLDFAQFVTTLWYILTANMKNLTKFAFLMRRDKAIINALGGVGQMSTKQGSSMGLMVRGNSSLEMVRQKSKLEKQNSLLPSAAADGNDDNGGTLGGSLSPSAKRPKTSGSSSRKSSPDKEGGGGGGGRGELKTRSSKKVSSKIAAIDEDIPTSPTSGKRPKTTGGGSRPSKKMGSKIETTPEQVESTTPTLMAVQPQTAEVISCKQLKKLSIHSSMCGLLLRLHHTDHTAFCSPSSLSLCSLYCSFFSSIQSSKQILRSKTCCS